MKLVPRLIPNAKKAWTHFSTQALALGVGIQGAWAVFPDDLKAGLPANTVQWVSRITALILLWGLIGKFVDQTPKDKP